MRTIRPRILISPSILAADFARLGDEIREVEAAGADMIHIDVMDGHFVPNLTMGPVVVQAVRSVTRLPIDAHLMIANPAQYAVPFVEAGASYVAFHTEASPDPAEVVSAIRRAGGRPGLALNPPNPADRVRPYLGEVDLLLIMSVHPGFAGQSFMADVMPKLETVARWKKERSLGFLIEVDGGIGPDNAGALAEHGAEILVAASAIFKASDRGGALRAIREAAELGAERRGAGPAGAQVEQGPFRLR